MGTAGGKHLLTVQYMHVAPFITNARDFFFLLSVFGRTSAASLQPLCATTLLRIASMSAQVVYHALTILHAMLYSSRPVMPQKNMCMIS